MTRPSPERLEAAYQKALTTLLAERTLEGHWVGELSTSALSTATAVMALALVQKHAPSAGSFDALITGGLDWLAAHQNADGGWGDTVRSLSNISTTMLCRAAFHLAAPPSERYAAALGRAEDWLGERHGRTPAQLAEAVRARYGKDRTFAVPILTTCALAGLVEWREVQPLPFELACFPQSWFRLLRLHVVSYALPALIGIGQCIYYYAPPWNPFTRLVRRLARKRSLKVLERIQPSNGGFLEATPLTSFVTLSLAASGLADHPVTRKGVEFIVQSVRPDGSWPIDTNLSTWVTTLSINALAAAGELEKLDRKEELRDWLLRQQYRERHPYTGAAPGGWAWTPLPGGVPDADDTPGALIALVNLSNEPVDGLYRAAFGAEDHQAGWEVLKAKYPWRGPGFEWLAGLQNMDGGWPTFCRGWGALPFDRSGCDLTAHVLRALAVTYWFDSSFFVKEVRRWMDKRATKWFNRMLVPKEIKQWIENEDLEQALTSLAGVVFGPFAEAFYYLRQEQRPDGSWLPLWFGNQHAPDDINPTYGTARVLAAYRDLHMMDSEPARRGVAWLVAHQNPDGGWGGGLGTPSSVEETALAVEILLNAGPDARAAVNNGLGWLVQQVESGGLDNPSPIGFYFARLWYFEKLYPIIFTVAALGRARPKTS